MHLLDLLPEVLSLMLNDTDRDTLLTLCLTEKHLFHAIARRFLRRNVAVVIDSCQKPKLNLLSFDTSHLSASRTFTRRPWVSRVGLLAILSGFHRYG